MAVCAVLWCCNDEAGWSDDRLDISGGVRQGLAGVEELVTAGRAVISGAEELVHDGGAETSRRRKNVAPIAFNDPWPAPWSMTTTRARPTRIRSCATSRKIRHPDLAVSGNLRGAGFTGHCNRRRVRPADCHRSALPNAGRRARVIALVDADPAAAAAGIDDSFVARIRRDPGFLTAAVWRCSSRRQPSKGCRPQYHSDRLSCWPPNCDPAARSAAPPSPA